MKRFLRKRWHSIPVALVSALLVLVLVAGSAFAAFNWLTIPITVEVKEPLAIEFNFDGQYEKPDSWLAPDQFDLDIIGHAGNDYDVGLRIHSASNNPLLVKLVVEGDTDYITFTGGIFNGVVVPADLEGAGGEFFEWYGDINIKIDGDAPLAGVGEEYTLTFTLTRE